LILELLNKDNAPLLHSSISLVSIVVSTLKGVIYLMSNGKAIVVHLIKILMTLTKR